MECCCFLLRYMLNRYHLLWETDDLIPFGRWPLNALLEKGEKAFTSFHKMFSYLSLTFQRQMFEVRHTLFLFFFFSEKLCEF